MESFFEIYEAYFYGIWFIILGIGCLAYMRYDKKTRTKEDEESEYKHSIAKSTRFNIYVLGYFGIIAGIFVILRELLS